MEKIKDLNELFDTTKMDDSTWNDRGLHRSKVDGERWSGEAVAIDFGIRVRYNPVDEYEPWGYEVTVPQENGFRNFLSAIGIKLGIGGIINGGNASFKTAEEAEKAAVLYARIITRRYKAYMEGQTKAKHYTLTLSLDSTDNEE